MQARKRCQRSIIVTAAVALVLALAASVPGCSGCGGGKAPLAYVPQDAVFVALVPSIDEGIKGLTKLLEKFRGEAPVKLWLEKNKAQVKKELGIDPENPESIKAKGIDPGRGIAVSVANDGESTAVVLGTSDPKAIEKFLRETATKVMGGSALFKEQKVGGVKTTLLTRQGAEDQAFAAWVHVKDHVIICIKAKDQKVGEHAVKISKLEAGLKKNKSFKELQGKIGKHQAMIYVDGASAKKAAKAKFKERLKTASEWMQKSLKERQETLDGFMAYFDGYAIGVHLSGKGATVRSYLAIPEEKGKVIAQILKGAGDSPDFGEQISPDALLVGRFSLHAKKLMDKMVELMPPREKRRLYRRLDRLEQETKVNVEKDVLTLLSGRYAFGLFAPGGDLLKSGFNIRRPEQAVSAIPMVAMAQVTSDKKAAEILATVERVMTREGTDVRVKTEKDRKIYYVGSPSEPVVSWTVAKGVAIVATGDRLAKTLTLIDKGGDNVLSQIDSSRAKKLLKRDDGIVGYFNISKTADLVRGLNLPAEAKLMLSSVTSTLAKFSDVTLSFEVEDEGVLGEIAVRLK